MDNPFFTVFEDKLNNNQSVMKKTLVAQTHDVLMPFRHYLNNSIDALKNKEVSCEWQPLTNNRYHLKPDLHIWRLTPISQLEILECQIDWYEIVSESDGTAIDTEFNPEISDPVIVGKGAERQRFCLNKAHFRKSENRLEIFLPEMQAHTQIQWSGYQLNIRSLSVSLDDLNELHLNGQASKVIHKNQHQLTIEGNVDPHSTLSINGQDIKFKILRRFDERVLQDFSPLIDGNGWLLFSKEKPNILSTQKSSHNETSFKIIDITALSLSRLSLGHFQCNGGSLDEKHWNLSYKKNEFILESLNNGSAVLGSNECIRCSPFPEISFTVTPCKQDEKWIQLIEIDRKGQDSGKSELDYFFDDNQHVKILDAHNKKNNDGFQIIKSRPEERQILLAKNTRGKKNWISEYPSQEGNKREIRVSVDTNQLQRQKNAINQLMSRPAAEHWPLIQLCQDRDSSQWPNTHLVAEDTIHWHVLTDPSFDGCEKQREFVRKAISNQDFTILDGPPGTGKTTTILELIIQLVLSKKRVLLSASTHAAINNVLERVKESDALMKHIFPLRIGEENNAQGVEEFQFDRLFEALKETLGCNSLTKQLMLDSSNLVCGTTLGILRLFNDKEINLDSGIPPFDVMIIDECSKTTFQEFLVPARFAKRWVLVGDVRQLSPFTDREQIVANLDNLMLVPKKGKTPAKTLSPAIQKACFLLEILRDERSDIYTVPMLIPVSFSVLQSLQQELKARAPKAALDQGLNNILLIQKENQFSMECKWTKDLRQLKQTPWIMYEKHVCFVDEGILGDVAPFIARDMLVLHSNWHQTSHAFEHQSARGKCKAFTIKTSTHTDTFEIQKSLLEQMKNSKWSEEVCWRLEREYWLRLSKNYQKKTGYLSQTLERLFPKSEEADGRVHVLKNIAFPSILEALSGDGLEKRRKEDPTTLNQGFNAQEKNQRHTTLTYQHRMHPDISAFPRAQFYPKESLFDGRQTTQNRQWEYPRYQTHNIWLNVQGKTHQNHNEKEVQAIITELKSFCEWAENKKKKNGEPYDVAILTFYKGQEKALREGLQKLPDNKSRHARFNYKNISIKLATVDYFQGQEADFVFLSMVNTQRDGFMDSPNRLNVSITRARYQLVIVGDHSYFSQRSRTDELRNLAKACVVYPNTSANLTRDKYK